MMPPRSFLFVFAGLAMLLEIATGSCASSNGYYVRSGTFVSQSYVDSVEKCCVICGAAVGSNNRGDWQTSSGLCNCYTGGTSSGEDNDYTAVSFSNVDDVFCADGVSLSGTTCAQNIVTGNARSAEGCMSWCQAQGTCQSDTNRLVGSSYDTQSYECRCTTRSNTAVVTGTNNHVKQACAQTYVNYGQAAEDDGAPPNLLSANVGLLGDLRSLCALLGMEKEGDAVQQQVSATSYSFLVQIPDSFVQEYLQDYNVCIVRGVVTPATLTPIWVSTYMASNMPFEYTVQYGAYWSTTEYQAGMTIYPSTNWDIDLGDCYYIGNMGARDPCSESNGDGLILKNTGDNDITVGMYSTMSTPSSSVPAASLNPFYAKKILAKSGWVLIQPLQTLTIGLCDYAEGQLVRAVSFAGELTWTVSTDGSDVIIFDTATNTFKLT